MCVMCRGVGCVFELAFVDMENDEVENFRGNNFLYWLKCILMMFLLFFVWYSYIFDGCCYYHGAGRP